ncbi:ferrochelatase [Lebetimonas natsushimae]|uniref:Ferrochelatase n=1 Tax=Lebetimonas natsushimae TaxID=1936991 RepID=A0A292YGR1_9BACT|nr:ferrochelatase [Lebetimonas natsushimae]GAX88055.1 ferrochelatase [Lebetimonas natsushimae]
MKAVVLMNMGGARNEKELKEFLFNMFMDKRIINSPVRYILAPLISNFRYKKVWKNYEKIGGSRIYKITQNLTNKLKNDNYDVLYSMRYSKPNLKDLNLDKYSEILFLPLYPHYSFTTFQSSVDEIEELNLNKPYKIIKPFYKNVKFNEIIKENILNSINDTKEWNLIFSAHGLPKSIIKKGDTYEKEINEHVNILKKLLPEFKSISLAFQSRFGPTEWLKPYLHEELKKYKNENVLIYPISFMIDNSETDLELKVEYAHLAKEIGIKNYKVVECPNDSEKTAEFLKELINESNNSKS